MVLRHSVVLARGAVAAAGCCARCKQAGQDLQDHPFDKPDGSSRDITNSAITRKFGAGKGYKSVKDLGKDTSWLSATFKSRLFGSDALPLEDLTLSKRVRGCEEAANRGDLQAMVETFLQTPIRVFSRSAPSDGTPDTPRELQSTTSKLRKLQLEDWTGAELIVRGVSTLATKKVRAKNKMRDQQLAFEEVIEQELQRARSRPRPKSSRPTQMQGLGVQEP